MGLFAHTAGKAFIEKLIEQQRDSKKTVKSGLKASLIMGTVGVTFVIIGIVLLVLASSSGVDASTRGFGKLIGLVAPIVGAVLIVGSLLMAVVSLLKPKKTVICPFCKKEHKLYASVSSYICDGCENLMLLDKTKPGGSLFVATCPVCYSAWAIAENYGETRCVNCGALLRSVQTKVEVLSQSPCTSCGNPLARGQYVCLACGAYHNNPRDNKTGLDTEEFRNSAGFFVNALWELKGASDCLAGTGDKTSTFVDILSRIDYACDEKHRFTNPALSSFLDHMLVLYYHSQINEDGSFRYFFGNSTEIDDRNSLYSKVNDIHASILTNSPIGSTALADRWPSPVLALEPAGSSLQSNNTFAYYAKVRNLSRIREFMAEHTEEVDLAEVVQTSLRLYDAGFGRHGTMQPGQTA